MRLKVISLFLAIQCASFALWQGAQAWKKEEISHPVTIEQTTEEVIPHEAADNATSSILFTRKTKEDDYFKLNAAKKNEIISVLNKLPSEHLSPLKNLILDYDPKAHRGLGGKNMIIIRGVDIDTAEFTSVMIHEIGHMVDLGYLRESKRTEKSKFKDGKKPIYEGDMSLDFYRISWKNDQERKRNASNLDFVSGYAITDPFEDFAETYVYYVLHNKEFKSLTQTSSQMLAKYNYMKDKIFMGKEFDTGEYLTENPNRRPWDITVLSYDLNNFLSS